MPFFCYFGGKWRAALRYPPPKYGRIVEPFAGAAGYSLRYPTAKVELYDKDPLISALWQYLIQVTEHEILNLPERVEHVDDIKAPQEAKWLVGFWLNKGSVSPRLTPSAWARSGVRPKSYWGPEIRTRIASQLKAIRHWKITEASYINCDDVEATWFIDPPYQGAPGRLYRYKIEEYEQLANWCKSRSGQVIVCERKGAAWLPFQGIGSIKATPGRRGKGISEEVIWEALSSSSPP